jgi:hypothetical protein
MILSIPYQALEVCNIHLSPFTPDKYGKLLARLAYKDASIDIHDVAIMTPPLTILDYNPENSRLRLDVSEHGTFQSKMFCIQENLISTFEIHQQSFLNLSNESHESIRNLFHFLLNDNVLCIYVYPTALVKSKDGNTCKMVDLKPGDTIRCVIRFHGISQIQTRNGMRLRLQHSIPNMWQITEK